MAKTTKAKPTPKPTKAPAKKAPVRKNAEREAREEFGKTARDMHPHMPGQYQD